MGRKAREDLCDLIGWRWEPRGRLQQLFWCRAGAETGELDLGERKERSPELQLAYLHPCHFFFSSLRKWEISF